MLALPPIFILFFHVILALAATNRTIDDTYGDSVTGVVPVYSPSTPGVWQKANCTNCYVNPDPAQAFMGSWTSATYYPALKSMSIDFEFKGTAIYIYFIQSNTSLSDGMITRSQCNFTIDGKVVGGYTPHPTSRNALNYNVLAYSNTSLANTNHAFSIVTTGSKRPPVLIIFDYAVYTSQDTSAVSEIADNLVNLPIETPTAVYFGFTILGIVLLGLLLALCFLYNRRRKKGEKQRRRRVTIDGFNSERGMGDRMTSEVPQVCILTQSKSTSTRATASTTSNSNLPSGRQGFKLSFRLSPRRVKFANSSPSVDEEGIMPSPSSPGRARSPLTAHNPIRSRSPSNAETEVELPRIRLLELERRMRRIEKERQSGKSVPDSSMALSSPKLKTRVRSPGELDIELENMRSEMERLRWKLEKTRAGHEHGLEVPAPSYHK